jgi:hypothetical protein
MTDLGVVREAGIHSGFSRGDVVSMAQVDAFNRRIVPVDWALGHKTSEIYRKYPRGTVVTDVIAEDLLKHGIKRVKIDATDVVVAAPIIKGVNTLPLVRTDDPLAKMSFERIKETLEEGVLEAQKSRLGKQPLPAVGFGVIRPTKK